MNILLCGCGALGSNLTRLLVPDLRGAHSLTLLDDDVVEERNIIAGTQWYTPDQLDLPKVEALQYNIYQAYQREILAQRANIIDIDPNTYDFVIDCFDNYRARNMVHNIKPPVIHLGFSDQVTFEIAWDEQYQVPSDIDTGMDICEMPGAAAFITRVAALGALTIEHFLRTTEQRAYLGNAFTHTLVDAHNIV